MARFSIAFTIPDDQVPRVVAAMKEHYGQIVEEVNGVATPRDRTSAELLDKLRETVIVEIKNIVSATEAATAARAAKTSLDGITLG